MRRRRPAAPLIAGHLHPVVTFAVQHDSVLDVCDDVLLDVPVLLRRPIDTDDPGALTRFSVTAHRVAELRHPNVARATVIDEQTLVVEWPDGPTLAEHLARVGRMTPRTALSVAIQIAEALTEAHRGGLSHPHLDASTVTMTADGDVRLVGLWYSNQRLMVRAVLDAAAVRDIAVTVCCGASGLTYRQAVAHGAPPAIAELAHDGWPAHESMGALLRDLRGALYECPVGETPLAAQATWEPPDEPARARRRRWPRVAIAALATLACGAAAVVGTGLALRAYQGAESERAAVAVPGVVGWTGEVAARQLAEVGLSSQREWVLSGQPPGTVVWQRPAGGGPALQGDVVKLGVARRPPQATIPDVGDLTQQTAEAALVLAGVKPQVRVSQSASRLRTEPEAGERVDEGSVVTLIVPAAGADEPAGMPASPLEE